MIKTALYFGSFNPVHVGHLIIAESILDSTEIDEVWMVVSPLNPFKEKKGLLDHRKRLELIEMATRSNSRVFGSDIEFDLPIPSYTIDTLAHLKKKGLKRAFSVIMGEDNLQGLHKWKNYEELISEHDVYVYPRLGYETDNLKEVSSIKRVKAPIIEISSTAIRQRIKEGGSIKYLTLERVEQRILEEGWYK